MLSAFAIPICSASPFNWNNNLLSVDGFGSSNAYGTTEGQAVSSAKSNALYNAYQNLQKDIYSISLENNQSIAQLAETNPQIKSAIAHLIKNAKITHEDYDKNSLYAVTLSIPIFGTNSLSEALWKSSVTDKNDGFAANNSNSPTGIVVDCREFNLNKALLPGIKDVNGRTIYEAKNISPSILIDQGMADYQNSFGTQKSARAGTAPIVIPAIGLTNLNQTPIISKENGDVILKENAATNFLAKAPVIFLE